MESFINIWQKLPSHIDPNLLSFGSFQLRYYSLMYIVAAAIVYFLVIYRIKNEKTKNMSRPVYEYKPEIIQDWIVWAMIGLIIGGRFGYALFYNFNYYFQHPLEIVLPFDFSHGIRFVGLSGMSYHGGVIGVAIASIYFCRKYGIDIWHFADLICPAIPLGYTFGRIGNFINGELWGRATTVPWGMYFPLDTTHQLRHPSQLYEAALEGLVLFAFLWLVRKKNFAAGSLLGLYIIGYGVVRFFIEFYREPDEQLGFVLSFLSMGQVLCIIMILAGMAIFLWRKKAARQSGT